MEQPEIEFLATNKYQITQTGSRTLIGLQVSWKGGTGTYQSGQKNGDLFGEAVQVAATASALYIDVSDDSLSFTGTSNVLGAFTMGAYFWGPASTNIAWFLVVPHAASITSDLLVAATKWRLALYLYQGNAAEAGLSYSTEAATYDFTTYRFTVPEEHRQGWIHLAHTYDPNQGGGTLRSYANGIEYFSQANLAMRVYGSQGAYASICIQCYHCSYVL